MRREIVIVLLVTCINIVLCGKCSNITIPAYFDPWGSTLQNWTNSIKNYPTMNQIVMNPSSGPGGAPVQDFVVAVNAAQGNGIDVLGYVYTSYGARSYTDIINDMTNYMKWYNVNGFFLDEVTNDAAHLAYYSTLVAMVYKQFTSIDTPLILNPGTPYDESYMTIENVTYVMFEDNYSQWLSFMAPTWINNYSADRYCFIVYDVSQSNLEEVINSFSSLPAGHIYLTNLNLPNPYYELPAYWSTFVDDDINACK